MVSLLANTGRGILQLIDVVQRHDKVPLWGVDRVLAQDIFHFDGGNARLDLQRVCV